MYVGVAYHVVWFTMPLVSWCDTRWHVLHQDVVGCLAALEFMCLAYHRVLIMPLGRSFLFFSPLEKDGHNQAGGHASFVIRQLRLLCLPQKKHQKRSKEKQSQKKGGNRSLSALKIFAELQGEHRRGLILERNQN